MDFLVEGNINLSFPERLKPFFFLLGRRCSRFFFFDSLLVKRTSQNWCQTRLIKNPKSNLNNWSTDHVISSVYQVFLLYFIINCKKKVRYTLYRVLYEIRYIKIFLNIMKVVFKKRFGKSRVRYIMGSLYQG